MSKVLFLVNHDVVIYNFRLELVEALLREGHEVYISSPYGERIDSLIELGCKYHEINISRHGMNPFKDIKVIRKYKKLMKKIHPDIVFSYTIKPNIYGAIAARSRKIPIVCNITGLGTAVENGGFSQKITVLLYKYAFTKVKKVFFQNTENQQFFIDHKIAIGKHDLLPGSGVNLTRFVPLEYPKTFEFAFISRIMKEKGIDQYLEAAKIIKEKHPETVFHICGFCEEEYEDILKKYSNDGIIVYHGMIRDVREIHKNICCTIHPTYYPEGISNVLLESCASARPIITTNRSGCREVVDDGINGFVVEQKNSTDLVNKIDLFLNLSYEDRKTMGLNARKKVEKEFDRNIIVNKYLELID